MGSMVSWQWVRDLWNLWFIPSNTWLWDQIGRFTFWISTFPDWIVAQTTQTQIFWGLAYAVIGIFLARLYWRDNQQQHWFSRSLALVFLMLVWGPFMALIAIFLVVFMGVGIFYSMWFCFGGVAAFVLLFFGTIFEGGFRLLDSLF